MVRLRVSVEHGHGSAQEDSPPAYSAIFTPGNVTTHLSASGFIWDQLGKVKPAPSLSVWSQPETHTAVI